MMHWILAGTGLLLALLAPRWKYVNLMGFAGLLGLLLGGGYLLHFKPTILMMAIGVGGVLFAALLLGRLVPRLFLLLMMLLAMAATIGPKIGAGMMTRVGAGIIALSLLILGLVMVRFGLRLVWALIGAAMIYSGDRVLLWIGVATGLFIVNWLTTRKVEYGTPKWGKTTGFCLVGSLLFAAGLLGYCRFLSGDISFAEITPPGTPQAKKVYQVGSREPGDTSIPAYARIKQIAPRGGLVWPLPSEAIFWGSPDYPPFEHLDGDYLFGMDDIHTNRPFALGDFSVNSRFELNSDVHKMRQIKSIYEINHLQTASTAIVTALKETLPLIKPGTTEAAVAKSIHEKQALHGCEADSFPPIIAAGEHAMTIHYEENSGALKDGDLVLMDIGCYSHHYASDFTRTLPINGKFTERQRKLYSAVYDAQQAAVKACKPGVYLTGKKERDGQKSLNMIVRETLRAHGVTGDFPHGVGHPLGLFVHDVFDWNEPLKPGMVIMIEPGLYLEQEKTGIRLEDAYLVTKDGCELMTTGFPADPDSIEKMMAEQKP